MTDAPALDAFTRTAERAANEVIDSYSTSFGLATRLLGARHRQHVRNIYALVRVADEIVDGVAAASGLSLAQQRARARRLRRRDRTCSRRGYSADVVVHAFAGTARASGIGKELVGPVFRRHGHGRRDARAPARHVAEFSPRAA